MNLLHISVLVFSNNYIMLAYLQRFFKISEELKMHIYTAVFFHMYFFKK